MQLFQVFADSEYLLHTLIDQYIAKGYSFVTKNQPAEIGFCQFAFSATLRK